MMESRNQLPNCPISHSERCHMLDFNHMETNSSTSQYLIHKSFSHQLGKMTVSMLFNSLWWGRSWMNDFLMPEGFSLFTVEEKHFKARRKPDLVPNGTNTGLFFRSKFTEIWSEKYQNLSILWPIWPTVGLNLTSLKGFPVNTWANHPSN